MDKLISVVVPVYRVEQYLDECVNSIVNQTYQNLEIILVDDGSPDNCPKMCDEWAKKDVRIKVLHKKNGGLAAARKSGLLKSTGEYVCFVDSDDFIDERTCEIALNTILQNDADIVVYDWQAFPKWVNGMLTPENFSDGALEVKTAVGELVIGNMNNYFWNKLYKRSVLQEVDFLEGRIWEDIGVMYNIFLNAKKIYCTTEKLYYYRMREGSIIHSMSQKALEDIFFAQKKRYFDLLVIYPDIARVAFKSVATSAIRLYDRSLWCAIDEALLKQALEFLYSNKTEILALENKKRYVWFYRSRPLYNTVRLLRHKVGNLVKKFK